MCVKYGMLVRTHTQNNCSNCDARTIDTIHTILPSPLEVADVPAVLCSRFLYEFSSAAYELDLAVTNSEFHCSSYATCDYIERCVVLFEYLRS